MLISTILVPAYDRRPGALRGCFLALLGGALLAGYLISCAAGSAQAVAFTVNSTADAVDANPGDGACATAARDCTLRAAVQESNAQPGPDLITLPAGVYALDIQGGFGEQDAASGDLDISDDLEIVGGGAEDTVIDGGLFSAHDLVDVAFHVHRDVLAVISGVTIQHAGHILSGGGAIFNQGTLKVTGSILRENKAHSGAGIYNFGGALTLNDSAFIQNSGGTGESAGAGVLSEFGGTLTISDVEFTDNAAGILGGAIASVSPATLNRVTVKNNRVGLGTAGGIFNGYIMTLADSTISGNSPGPGGRGGGIFNGANGRLAVTNSTISGNSAGGIHNEGNASLTNVTITGNTLAIEGGGIFHDTTSGGALRDLTLTNTIVANNSGGDCGGPSASALLSAGHNLSSDGSCRFTGAGDMTNVDPLLGPLTDNGGPTQTQALLAGSMAIDAGDNGACPATDQRGITRPVDGNADGVPVCDIGAYELQLESCAGDVNGDRAVDALDVRLVARSMHARPGSTRWNEAADVNGDGVIDVADLRAVLRLRKAGGCR